MSEPKPAFTLEQETTSWHVADVVDIIRVTRSVNGESKQEYYAFLQLPDGGRIRIEYAGPLSPCFSSIPLSRARPWANSRACH